MEMRLSLCVSYPNYKDTNKYITFRAADFVEGRFTKATYTYDYNTDDFKNYHPKHIGFRHHEISEPCMQVRRWWIDRFPRTESEIDKTPFYEIIFIEELNINKINNKNDIRDILINGFKITEGISDKLLIVIDTIDEYYIVLECSRKDFTFANQMYKLATNNNDIRYMQHYFFIHSINKEDVMSTEDLSISISTTEKARTRYFYTYHYLEPTTEKFYLRDIKEYVPKFLNKYIKQQKSILGYTNNEIKNMINVIQEALEDQQKIEDFFEVTGYTYDDIEKSLLNYERNLIDYLMSSGDMEVVIKSYLARSGDVYNKCLVQVEESWFANKNSDRDSLNEKIQETQHALEGLKLEVNQLLAKKEEYTAQLHSLKEDVNNLSKKKKSIQAEITQELSSFEDKLVNKISTSALFKSLNMNSIEGSKDFRGSPMCIIHNGEKIEGVNNIGRMDSLEDIEDILSDLSDNMQIMGVKSDYSFGLAQSVIASICVNMGLLIPDYYARGFANAVAALVESSISQIINLPVGYRDVAELKNIIQQSQSKVILIENALDGLAETVCISLIKECPDKILIFSLIDTDNLSVLSKDIWGYLIYLDIEKAYYYPQEEGLLYGEIGMNVFNMYIKPKKIQQSLNDVLNLCKGLKLPRTLMLKYAEIIYICKEYFRSPQINIFLMLQIMALHKDIDNEDVLLRNMSPFLNEHQKQLIYAGKGA